MMIESDRSCLIVVDVQERLLPAVERGETVVANATTLMRAARRLNVPMLLTEQYPKGIGRTVTELARLAPNDGIVEKLAFSAAAEPEALRRIEGLGRRQVVIAGIEAHVCVLQTALGLLERGFAPVVVQDAVSSRRTNDKDHAMARLRANGVEVVTTEMVVFEWMGRAGTAEFKDVHALVK